MITDIIALSYRQIGQYVVKRMLLLWGKLFGLKGFGLALSTVLCIYGFIDGWMWVSALATVLINKSGVAIAGALKPKSVYETFFTTDIPASGSRSTAQAKQRAVRTAEPRVTRAKRQIHDVFAAATDGTSDTDDSGADGK